MELRCSYHLRPWKEYFEILKLEEGVVVHIVYNKACMVHDIGMVKLKMFYDCEFILHNVR